MIAVDNKAYIFGGVVGLLSDRRDVLVMNENFKWKKHFQTLRNSRRDFRSVLYTDAKESAFQLVNFRLYQSCKNALTEQQRYLTCWWRKTSAHRVLEAKG